MDAMKPASKGMVIALGMICIILAACLAGVVVVCAFVISGKDSTVSSLDTKVSQLDSNVTNLQNQLDSLLNGSLSSGEIIMSDPSPWVNSTVTVEGSLSGVLAFPAFESCPWNEELSSGNLTIGVYISNSARTFWNQSDPYVRIQGLMMKGEITYTGNIFPPEVTYYVEAEVIESI